MFHTYHTHAQLYLFYLAIDCGIHLDFRNVKKKKKDNNVHLRMMQGGQEV